MHHHWMVMSALIKATLFSQWDLIFWRRLKGQKRRNNLHVQCHCFRAAKSVMGIMLPGFKRWIGEVTLNLEKVCTFLFFISCCLLFILLNSEVSIVIFLLRAKKKNKKGTFNVLLKSRASNQSWQWLCVRAAFCWGALLFCRSFFLLTQFFTA